MHISILIFFILWKSELYIYTLSVIHLQCLPLEYIPIPKSNSHIFKINSASSWSTLNCNFHFTQNWFSTIGSVCMYVIGWVGACMRLNLFLYFFSFEGTVGLIIFWLANVENKIQIGFLFVCFTHLILVFVDILSVNLKAT